jgi:hypothetical protein
MGIAYSHRCFSIFSGTYDLRFYSPTVLADTAKDVGSSLPRSSPMTLVTPSPIGHCLGIDSDRPHLCVVPGFWHRQSLTRSRLPLLADRGRLSPTVLSHPPQSRRQKAIVVGGRGWRE